MVFPKLSGSEVHDHLEQWLRVLRVDEAAARRWTCQRDRSPKQYLTALRIEALQSGEARVILDAYGRVHTPRLPTCGERYGQHSTFTARSWLR